MMNSSTMKVAVLLLTVVVSTQLLWTKKLLGTQACSTLSNTASSGGLAQSRIITKSSSSSRRTGQSNPLWNPPTCTAQQRRAVGKIMNWTTLGNTNCPETVWLEQTFHQNLFLKQERDLLAISVGCNKGDDAVDILALLTQNATYSSKKWESVFANITQQQGMTVKNRACKGNPFGQAVIEQNPDHYNNHQQHRHHELYCIEAMPSTAATLTKAVESLGWQDQLKVVHAAMGSQDGSIRFPTKTNQIGVESLGIGHCNLPRFARKCTQVPQYKLDTFTQSLHDKDKNKEKLLLHDEQEQDHDDFIIDILSIDTEGYDWEILKNSTHAIAHTRYLEFEYHYFEPWLYTNLSTAVQHLHDSFGMVCYFAGVGQLFRLNGDDCFQYEYMNNHEWSNVACVNTWLHDETGFQKRLVQNMENIFLATIEEQ